MKIPFGELRETYRLVAFGVLTALLAPCALANAGTPLMMLTGLHVLFGNAVIGVAEGILLWPIFRKSA